MSAPRAASRLLPALALALLAAAPARAGDDEAATNLDAAATPATSFEARHGSFVLRQYQLGCLSQLTYLLGGDGEAAVVDPQRDVDHYLRDAAALGLSVKTVLLTHTNADFVAGHTELARRVGAKIAMSGESGSKFDYQALRDGDRIRVGPATVEALATPGHTLDCMTYLVHVPGAPADPAYALTGDTLFVGGIGRPDLVGGDVTPVLLAGKAFESMARLRALPDATVVLPAHGAGSLCGAHLSPETTSTIGRERLTNPYLQPMSRAQFVSRVVSGLPVAPAYFAHNVRINRDGPPVVERGAPPPLLPAADAKARVAAGAWVVDLRDAKAYAAGHVEGAVNVAVRGRLDTWTGIVVPFTAPIVLVGSEAEVAEAAFRYRRIGIDTVAGRLAVDPEAWAAGGLAVRTSRLVSPADLAAALQKGAEPILVDVRTADEYEDARIGDYANLPLSAWESFGRVLDPKSPVLFVCNSAYRSSMAVGLAERQGFRDVASLDGGLDAWLTAGLPTKGRATVSTPAAPAGAEPAAAPPGAIAGGWPLPEPMEPRALAAALADQPTAYDVVDVRPAFAFDEYHVPGATRLESVEALAAHVRSLAPGVRVVLVDRDGTAAFAVAGALVAALRDPTRSVRVLVGGTARYHQEIEQQAAGASGDERPAGPGVPATPAAPAPAPKKRPAGC